MLSTLTAIRAQQRRQRARQMRAYLSSTKEETTVKPDPVNHPPHYVAHPSGVECIQITEHMNFCLGNALKYIWRAGLKGDAIEDLKKARFYLDREIERRTKETTNPTKENDDAT